MVIGLRFAFLPHPVIVNMRIPTIKSDNILFIFLLLIPNGYLHLMFVAAYSEAFIPAILQVALFAL